jgi:hypothetical protein
VAKGIRENKNMRERVKIIWLIWENKYMGYSGERSPKAM